ncbi:hypothetical protein V7164_24045, partial [Bacillus sp. JJ1474]
MANLSKQVSIYSLDTADFYNEREHKLHTEIEALKVELYLLEELIKLSGKEQSDKLNEITKKNKKNVKLINKLITHLEDNVIHEKNVMKMMKTKDAILIAKKQRKSLRTVNANLRKSKKGKSAVEKANIDKLIATCKSEIEFLTVFITIFDQELNCFKELKSPKKILSDMIDLKKDKLKELFDKNNKVRVLREDSLIINNAISVFDSVLTRTLGCNDEDEICTDIIIVQSYYYSVLENLITKGFINADGEQYVYFSSSAGQIRKKRGVFVKKALWEQYEN